VVEGHSDYEAIFSHKPFILLAGEAITEDYIFDRKAPVIMAKVMPKALELAEEAKYPHEILTFEINSDDLND